jgi:NitT/TauT family transport system permease protein
MAGIDALEIPLEAHPTTAARVWSATWPKLAAIGGFLLLWQAVVWSGWKPPWALPGPGAAFAELVEDVGNSEIPRALVTTMARAGVGYGLALVVGTLIGLAVSGNKSLRAAMGSLITGLQTMPSIAWFPLAILLWGLTEQAILFVVVLGAAPAIANGLINAIDHIPPILLNAGRVLGAKRWSAYRHVILPAAFPSFIGGMKQGWAFAWRSLIAGELIVIIATRPSLGVRMQLAGANSDAPGLIAAMIVILIVGIVVDALFFARIERIVRTRWGLAESL